LKKKFFVDPADNQHRWCHFRIITKCIDESHFDRFHL